MQHIYNGWALLGVVVFPALLSTLVLAMLVRKRHREFGLVLAALLCLVAAQVLFWTFTFPANQETGNWTSLPAHWESLRVQWEYSHAGGALLTLAAFILLLLAVL